MFGAFRMVRSAEEELEFVFDGLASYYTNDRNDAQPISLSLTFKADGTWTIAIDVQATIVPPSPLSGTWRTGSFSGGDYEIIFDDAIQNNVGGTVTNGAATYQPLSSDRTYQMDSVYDGNNGAGELGVVMDITIREIAVPSNNISTTVEIDQVTS